MHRAGWDLQLTEYGNGHWRATFYVTGQARSIVGGTAWEPTPWTAVQRAAWGALRRDEAAGADSFADERVSGRRRPRWLRGASIAPIPLAGRGAALRLAASIRDQRAALLVHLLEPALGRPAGEEGRVLRLQQLALARLPAQLRRRTAACGGALTLCCHGEAIEQR